jgi:uncharacterized protein (TIGR02001 family)
MNMKKFIGITSAALAATALTVSAGVDIDIVSAYVWRGVTINDEVNVQPGFETTIFGEAVTVGTWANFNTDTSEFDEIDYYLGYSLPLGEDSPVSADIVYTEYTYPGAEGDADREFGLVLGHEAGDLGIELGIYYGVDGAAKKTLYIELGLGYSVPVAENISLDLGAVLHYWNPDEGDSGFNAATFSAALGVVIPEIELPISFGLSYVLEIDDKVAEVDEDLFFTIGFSL